MRTRTPGKRWNADEKKQVMLIVSEQVGTFEAFEKTPEDPLIELLNNAQQATLSEDRWKNKMSLLRLSREKRDPLRKYFQEKPPAPAPASVIEGDDIDQERHGWSEHQLGLVVYRATRQALLDHERAKLGMALNGDNIQPGANA